MSLDSRYIVAPSIQTLFRDKDTGTPMSNGFVYFYRDVDRNALKPVYQLVGTPGNYTYQALPNPVPLNSIGTYSSNSADDIQVYLYPYLADGVTVDLYYIKVFNSENIEQFDRQAQPPGLVPGGGGAGTESENFIANGQFNLHLIPPGDATTNPIIPEGQITQDITNIAYGGWTFERPSGSTSVDKITFPEDSTYSTTPPNNPRFRLMVENTSGGVGDLFKDIRIKFENVNRFSSDSQFYTLGFTGRSESLSNVTINILIYKFYGSGVGASLPSTTNITSITLTPSDVAQLIPFVFGNNTGKIITGDDDYVSIVIRLPLNSAFSMSAVDFFLYKNNIPNAIYPTTTTRQDLYRSLVGTNTNPSYNGFDLYLNPRYGPNGLEPDDSLIGKVFVSSSPTPDIGELLCDGSQYLTEAYSDDGIPYRRLQQKIFDSTLQVPLFGTGKQYFTLYSDPNNGYLINNGNSLVVSATANGAVPTPFTFSLIHQSQATFNAPATDYGVVAYMYDGPTGGIYVEANQIGVVTVASAGTTTFTIIDIHNNAAMRAQFAITVTAVAAGQYFLFSAKDPSLVNRDYYIWFNVSGAGSDPLVPGRTGIQCRTLAGDTIADIAVKVKAALNGQQAHRILFTAGSTITSGQYFLASAAGVSTAVNYLIWYRVNGSGTEPIVAGRTNIRVDINSTDTAAIVLSKTQLAINSKYFAVPDPRGLFIRGWDPTSIRDRGERLSLGIYEDNNIGSLQRDSIYSHIHGASTTVTLSNNVNLIGPGNEFDITISPVNAGQNTVGATAVTTIDSTGNYETYPWNMVFNLVIKY